MEGGEGWQQAKDTQEDGDVSTLGLTVDADIHFAYTFLDVSVKRQASLVLVMINISETK